MICHMKNRLLFIFLFFAVSVICRAQDAGFSMPDTLCEDYPVVITNVQPPSAISYKWSFCTGNASNEPDGDNLGSPNSLLSAPRFITVVNDGPEYYTFTTSTGNAKVIRCYYGNSLIQNPLAITDLGNFNVLSNEVTGIQVKKDKGTWFGYVANGNKLVRLVFGSSLSNIPTSQVIDLSTVIMGCGLAVAMQNAEWVGFLTDISGNNLVRLDFGQNLGNDPVETNLGNIGQLNSPASIILATENDNWYAFICNLGNSTLSRIKFGSSLMNPAPGGSPIPNIGGLILNSGISLVIECGTINGFVANCVQQVDLCIVHLVFKQGLGGPVSGYQIPNNGILNKPYGISEFVRQGDTLYALVANYGSSTITRMYFPSCADASLPFYSGIDPPPITYHVPGSYNVMLTVVDQNSAQSSKCKNVVVMPKPILSLGPDRTICKGKVTTLNAGTGDSLYLWSTGARTQSIVVDATGKYWVKVVNSWKCEVSDTIKVTLDNPAPSMVDTTICKGQSYWAQNALQYSTGVYHDTLRSAKGCDSLLITNLQVSECPLEIWFPTAFSPNGDGLNDYYMPVGKDIIKYKLQIFDRWGTLIFESGDITYGWDGKVKGRDAGPEVYTYNASYESKYLPGVIHKVTGTFTLSK